MSSALILFIRGVFGLQLLMLLWAATRYKRCPSDKILVVYGKTGKEQEMRCLHGGAAFIWPILQDFAYLDLTPFLLEISVQDFKTNENKELEGKAGCLLYTSPSPRDLSTSRMPSSA